MGDEVGGFAALAGVAKLGGLPVGGPRGKVAVADRRVQRDDVAEVGEPGLGGEGDGEPGQVEHAALAPGVLGDHDESPAGTEYRVTSDEDLGHCRGIGGSASVADVGPVGRVVEGVGRTEPAAGQPGGLVDHPGVARVRRGGDDQVDPAGEVAQDLGEAPGVAVANLGPAALLAGQHVIEVRTRPGRPSGPRVPRRPHAGRVGRPRPRWCRSRRGDRRRGRPGRSTR